MIEKLIEDLDIKEIKNGIEEALKYEIAINNKKEVGAKLTKEEYFYDTYTIKPSTILRIILRIGEKNEKK